MKLYTIVYYSMLWVDLLPILIFLFSLKKFCKSSYIFFFRILLSSLTQWIVYFFAINNLPSIFIMNFFVFIDFVMLSFIYFNEFKDKNSNYLFVVSGVVFGIMYFIDFKLDALMQNALITSAVIYVIWSLYALVDQISTQSIKRENDHIMLYFNISLLIYFSGSVFMFFVFDYLNSSNYSIWTAHNILEIISYLIISYAFWKQRSKSISFN